MAARAKHDEPDDVIEYDIDDHHFQTSKSGEVMSQTDTLHLAQEFLDRLGSGAEPAKIAELFSENMEWEIAGDTGVLPLDREKVRQELSHRFRH